MMNTNSDTAGPFYVADTGSVILKLKWISSNRVLLFLIPMPPSST